MGIFKQSPQEIDVEKATSENIVQDDWGQIMAVCDKAGKTQEEARAYLRAILKRLNHVNPNVCLKTVTLLDACVKNSGLNFHLEIASAEFETEFTKLLAKSHPKVVQKLKESLKRWAEGDFKNDTQLNLIPALYVKLKHKGVDFTTESQQVKKTTTVLSKDPNVVQSQEEEDQIAKAIELSLKETSGSPRMAASTSLYPSTNLGATSLKLPSTSTPQKEPRKVRALYDFEAAEDNELTFNSGEIIVVIDDSDENWWKGSNHRGEGLFPASFVTADLSADPEQIANETKKKAKQETEEKKGANQAEDVEVNEDKIDRLLHLLHEADPTNSEHDTEEMLRLEREVNGMGPLIDSELERVDRRHAQLTQLSSDLVEALNLYHTLMREPMTQAPNKLPYGYPQQPPHSAHPMVYDNSMPPPNMPGPSMNPYNTLPGHDRTFVPPPHTAGPYPGMPQGLPGIPMPPVMGPMPGGPLSFPPPSMGHPSMVGVENRIPPNQTHLPPSNFGPQSIPPGSFQPNGPQINQMPQLQNGPQPGHFPPAPNTHIM